MHIAMTLQGSEQTREKPLPADIIVDAFLVASYQQGWSSNHSDLVRKIMEIKERGVDIRNVNLYNRASGLYSEDLDRFVSILGTSNVSDFSPIRLTPSGYAKCMTLLKKYQTKSEYRNQLTTLNNALSIRLDS